MLPPPVSDINESSHDNTNRSVGDGTQMGFSAQSASNLVNPLAASSPIQPPANSSSTAISPIQARHASLGSDKDTLKQMRERYAVEAMKAIEENADDPYKQTQLIEKVKQGYLRDVYHHNVKSAET